VNNNWIKGIGVWLVVGIVLMMVFMQLTGKSAPREQMDYSVMMSEAKNGNIDRVREEGLIFPATCSLGTICCVPV
jgi:cell division protease FtsH